MEDLNHWSAEIIGSNYNGQVLVSILTSKLVLALYWANYFLTFPEPNLTYFSQNKTVEFTMQKTLNHNKNSDLFLIYLTSCPKLENQQIRACLIYLEIIATELVLKANK